MKRKAHCPYEHNYINYVQFKVLTALLVRGPQSLYRAGTVTIRPDLVRIGAADGWLPGESVGNVVAVCSDAG